MLYNEATIGYERAAPLQSIHANNYGPPLGSRPYGQPGPLPNSNTRCLIVSGNRSLISWLLDNRVRRLGAYKPLVTIRVVKVSICYIDSVIRRSIVHYNDYYGRYA